MSINPLLTLSYIDSENFNPDLHGTRRFALESNPQTLATVRELYNGKLKPYLIDFNTLEIGRPKHLSANGEVQRVSIPLKYKDPLGKPHSQAIEFERYGLREVLLTRLESEDYWFKLPCNERIPFGILIAILDKTGVKFTLEDVDITFINDDLILLEAKTMSVGWYGEVYLRLV